LLLLPLALLIVVLLLLLPLGKRLKCCRRL